MTDELRAKFEAWWVYYFRDGSGLPPSRRSFGTGIYTVEVDEILWTTWQAAYASRNAEVEALKRDAERYRWLRRKVAIIGKDGLLGRAADRYCVFEFCNLPFPTYIAPDPSIELDAAIDDAMAKESGE